MPATLTVAWNLKWIAFWLLVLVLGVVDGISDWWMAVALCGLGGLVAGGLQARALNRLPIESLAAMSNPEAHRALEQSLSGRASIALTLLTGIGLPSAAAFAHMQMPLQTMFTAWAMFYVAREACSLPARYSLSKRLPE
ncbi:hypothetical protein SNE35_10375 [Paucibacter sp. R3-3]|uniref:Uncharacterized protein n=1 Tax=Roseateles agri TaxID=3098619 RepID=A0ABU5DGU4_9BURK|nr:hypothetical protein [Paucibacter sp. R3-3]MDY0744915.1 hypothetical protein [Paucibacter sp. R3-3]